MRALASLLLLASPLWLLELRRAIPGLELGAGVAVDPLAVGLAVAALRAPAVAACVWAAACGLALEGSSALRFGLAPARLAFVAAVLTSLRADLDARSSATRCFTVFLAASLEKTIAAVALELAEPQVPFFVLVGRGLLGALLTAAATPILWPAAEALLPPRPRAERGRA